MNLALRCPLNTSLYRFKLEYRRQSVGKREKDSSKGTHPSTGEKKFHQSPGGNAGEARRLVKSRADESWRFPDAWLHVAAQCWEIIRLYERVRAWNISRGRSAPLLGCRRCLRHGRIFRSWRPLCVGDQLCHIVGRFSLPMLKFSTTMGNFMHPYDRRKHSIKENFVYSLGCSTGFSYFY